MTGAELLAYLRTDVLRDTALPYLWSDDYLFRMLSEAQRQFARKTYAIVSNLEIDTDLPVADADGVLYGTAVYDTPNVLFVWSVYNAITEDELRDVTRRRLPTFSSYALGTPSTYALNEGYRQIRFAPTPNGFGGEDGAAGAYRLVLRASVLPSGDITEDTNVELPEEYHLDLCEFVAWRALLLPDEDTQNPELAKVFKSQWDERIAVAKSEIYRRMMGSNPHAVQDWTKK